MSELKPAPDGLRNIYKRYTGRRMTPMRRLLYRLAAPLIYGIARLWWHSVRIVAVVGEEHLEAALAKAPSFIPCYWHQHTLLCVEDNPANLMLVEKLLERRPDIRLLVARDGIRGIEMVRTDRPDVILMDINLPGISGLVALGILADDPKTANIPVIALSANALPGDIKKGLAAGFYRYLTKPIKVEEFMDTLDSALAFANRQTGDGAVLRGAQ